MSAFIGHRDYCGFFPFVPSDYAKEKTGTTVPVAGSGTNGVLGSLVKTKLALLVPLWWTAKDGALELDISYNFANGAGVTDIGSISGTTALAVWNQAGANLMELAPGARTASGASLPLLNYVNGTGFTSTGEVTVPANPPTTPSPIVEPYDLTSAYAVDLMWPSWLTQYVPDASTNGLIYATLDNTATPPDWYTRFLISKLFLNQTLMTTDPGDPTLGLDDGYGPLIPAGNLDVSLQMNGATVTAAGATFPVYCDPTNLNWTTCSVTGSLILNFNTFWT